MKDKNCLSRRQFLVKGGTTVVTIMLSSLPGMAHAEGVLRLTKTDHPRKKIGTVSGLEPGKPANFLFPYDHPNCAFSLIRLGEEAAGGVGPGKDIVAFSRLCAHMGGALDGLYKSEFNALGPCPIHLSVFDLRRHGMLVSGHATESLPQAILETEGDDIFAVGILGLLFGFHDNSVKP